MNPRAVPIPDGRVADPAESGRADTNISAPTVRPAQRVRRTGRYRPIATQVGVIVAALLIWWLGSVQAPPGTVPSPADTFFALSALAPTPTFWGALWETIQTFLLGIFIVIVVGIPLGLGIGLSRFATVSTRLTFDFLRTIPPVAILPLVLLMFGPSPTMVLVMVVLGAIWPVIIQSVYAARQTEPQLYDMARAFGIRGWWRTSKIFLPSVLPFVLTGLRIATTICLLLTITGELLGAAPGIGSEIRNALNAVDNPGMYAYVVTAAILGVAVNGGFWIVQRRLLRWHPSFREEGAS